MRIDLKSPVVQVGAISVAFAGGWLVGWLLAKRKFVTLAETEIAEAKSYYEHKFEKRVDQELEGRLEEGEPEVELDEAEEILVNLGYVATESRREQRTSYNRPVKQKAVVVASVTEVLPDDGVEPRLEWDYESELTERQHEVPYIIHRDEFDSTIPSHTKVSYEYYDDDNTLVDEGGSVLSNMYALIGVDTLNFGHGSGDPKVVFVRNEVLQLDFEINLIEDSYAEKVLGFEPEPELRHADYGGRRRRDFDG